MAADANMPLQLEQNALSYVRLHPRQGQSLSLHPGPKVGYRLGPQHGQVLLIVDPHAPTDRVVISSAFANELRIKSFAEDLTVRITSSGILLQTVIGILCTPVWQSKAQTLRPSKQLPVLEKLCNAAAKEHAVAFVFSLNDVDLKGMRIKGYRYVSNQWLPQVMPLPNVIYDQVVSRRIERRQETADRRSALSSLYEQALFNDGFLDKWQVHEWLQTDQRTKVLTPETVRFTTVAHAAKFISKYPFVYCKPVHGSLGRGIVRIGKTTDGAYEYVVSRAKAEALAGKASTALDALKTVRGRLAAQPYVIQQGIALQTYDNRPFDIRIVLQRDGSGRWMRTKTFARVADTGKITSNLSSGGAALPVPTVLSALYTNASQRQRVMTAIRRTSMHLPDVIEAASGKQYGELGIDIGLDTKGNLWIIEVNSKPWKSVETQSGRKDLVELAFARPMKYAVYLAEQQA